MDKVIAIVGPTASGKSSLALQLAERVGGEIVSCDSVQVYRRFSIGCAKPSADEQARIRHHVIDVVDWGDEFDAEHYRQLAEAAITDILARGKQPIVCGGTGLYLRALRFGLLDLPKADPALRKALYAQETEQPGSLYQTLQACDPDGSTRIEPNNLVHVVRALEIHHLTGEPASALRAQHGFKVEHRPITVAVLESEPVSLRQRIEARVHGMLHDGLLNEVSQLLADGVSHTARPMVSVGYKEARDVVLGHADAVNLHASICDRTWGYARRQRTWFRRERDAVRLQPDSDRANVESLLRLVG